jgi:glycosyltransferase involved in cell wall biosynthesis
MAIKQPLTIGYSGTLSFYEGEKAPSKRGGLRDWFWTYNHHNTDPSTRSASFLFRAVSVLVKKYGAGENDIRILLWGKIDPSYRQQADALGIGKLVQIDGYLPKQESLARNEACDLLFLPMESPTPLGNPLFIPGKAFEYMNARKPVLALSAPCDCMDILQPSGLLQRFEPQNAEGIAHWLHEVISDRSRLRSYIPDEAYIRKFSFREVTAQVAGVFDELLKKNAG